MADVITGLPCNSDGLCMVCNQKPLPEELFSCTMCASPWHLTCLSVRPETSADVLVWQCPDCTNPTAEVGAGGAGSSGDLVAAIRALETDESFSEVEKAKKRQELMSKNILPQTHGDSKSGVKRTNGGGNAALDILMNSISCTICFELPERPVTTPCGHNFCLKCFEKWVAQGKSTCANCRQAIPSTLKINSNLVGSIRIAKASQRSGASGEHVPHQLVHRLRNQDRPDKAFRTERAVKPGNANASSGRIFVTAAPDHFGPITAEYDPERNKGVAVGETWRSRLECRQWGIHRPMVAGIAGQGDCGAQSVVLSGGYIDDEDHGEWFIYTGSGGKDLTGNKRTNSQHSSDQTFTNYNQALRLSCLKGYPVRVVRSYKEKRSSYAPAGEKELRYDGVYKIEKCWRKVGKQFCSFRVCRYLFVRCDNEPAPWTSDDHGDRPRPLPIIVELDNGAIDVTETKGSPSWDYDEETKCWMWKKPPPLSKQPVDSEELEDGKKVRRVRGQGKRRQEQNMKEKVLREFKCGICHKIMTEPVTTPCGHNFCKGCLQGAFAGVSLIKQRTCQGRRTLRAQKNVMKCPNCPHDIAEFLQNPQVNKSLENAIELLQQKEEDVAEEVEDVEKDEEAEQTYNASEDSEAEANGACAQKNPSHKRKRSSDGENMLDGGTLSERSKKNNVEVASNQIDL